MKCPVCGKKKKEFIAIPSVWRDLGIDSSTAIARLAVCFKCAGVIGAFADLVCTGRGEVSAPDCTTDEIEFVLTTWLSKVASKQRLRPGDLQGREVELWDEFIGLTNPLDEGTLHDWCILKAGYENAAFGMTSTDIARMRMLGRELGMGA